MSPTARAARVVVDERFSGPRDTDSGGYACGVVARFVDGPAEVMLHRPVPLNRPLDARRHDDGSVTLHDRGVLLAEAGPALPLDLEPPRRTVLGATRSADATPLMADPTAPSQDGVVAPEVVWAALGASGLRADGRPGLLARMTAELIEPIRVGEPVVAVGWNLGGDRRRQHGASALVAADGRTLALAGTLWVRLRAVA